MIRKSECEELGLEANTKAVLEDVGHITQICISVYRQSRGQHAKLGAWPGSAELCASSKHEVIGYLHVQCCM